MNYHNNKRSQNAFKFHWAFCHIYMVYNKLLNSYLELFILNRIDLFLCKVIVQASADNIILVLNKTLINEGLMCDISKMIS